MKSSKQTFTITIPRNQGYMDLTDDVQSCVRNSAIKTGICTVNTMHNTASVFTAKNDPELLESYLRFYEKLTTLAEEPLRPAIMHQLAGNGVTMPVEDGSLCLGMTQYIIYMDFDGEREKLVEVTVVGE
ncbi:MAG: YjbQ family protein [Ruminiclostridium sp.]|nr:YjbQ family protein [Ruminiclostridium sp.]